MPRPKPKFPKSPLPPPADPRDVQRERIAIAFERGAAALEMLAHDNRKTQIEAFKYLEKISAKAGL